MAMSLGSNRLRAEINMTPMIDVLLVLIIIFMVITPVARKGLEAQVPQTPTADAAPALSHEIVISLGRNGSVRLNQEPLDLPSLQRRLDALFKQGAANVVFVRGDRDLQFHEIAEVIDLARGAGVTRIGLMTE